MKRYLYLLILIVVYNINSVTSAFGQIKLIKGTVIDKTLEQPIGFVSIYADTANNLGFSEEDGTFEIMYNSQDSILYFTLLGYNTFAMQTAFLASDTIEGIIIYLEPEKNTLAGTVVKSKRTRYSNKDNPAVALIKNVIAHKEKNYYYKFENLQYNQYEKIMLGVANVPKIFTNSFLLKKQSYVFDNKDTTTVPGLAFTPLLLQESVDQFYYKNEPNHPTIINEALKTVKFNESFISNKAIDQYLNHIYKNFDVVKDNDVPVMTNLFLSPLASTAPLLYKFFLGDTTYVANDTIVEVYFGPRNKNDFLFLGRLYVNLSNFAVERARLGISKEINLNFVTDMNFHIEYEKTPQGKYYMAYNFLNCRLSLYTSEMNSIYGEKKMYLRNLKLDTIIPDTVWAAPQNGFVNDKLLEQSDAYWQANRSESLTHVEQKTYSNLERLYADKNFNNKMNWLRLVIAGYGKVGPIEIGPTNTFYSWNPVEGFRGRVGGRTAINYSRNWMANTYVAYGFKDEKVKYYLSGSLGLYKDKDRKLYDYPYNYIKVTYQSDYTLPGQKPGFVQEGNFLSSFKRGTNDKYIFNKYFNLQYFRELGNHFSIIPSVQIMQQMPAGSWYYIKGNEHTNDTINQLSTTEVGVDLRWAPNETIIQSRTSRAVINNKHPIITGKVVFGLKENVFGGEYNYQRYEAGIFKRIYLSQFGFINTSIHGKYVAGNGIPFTLLDIPTANQSYWVKPLQFNLMNYLEFITDKSVMIDIDYHMYGFILNKIPLIRKLKFREVAGFKLLYGGLRESNKPIQNPELLKYPVNDEGVRTTRALGNAPYMEVNVGVENILKFFSAGVYWRLSYLDAIDISKVGFRFGLRVDF